MEAVMEGIHVRVPGREIVKGLDLSIKGGEVHAIMGPNGSGKSSLVNALAGHPAYGVEGTFTMNGEDMLSLKPEERARRGLFLSFQHPPFIEGVKFSQLLRKAYFARFGLEETVEAYEAFQEELERALKMLRLPKGLLERDLYKGFSGGEKKRGEMLQMLLLKPALAFIDEVDSGLDVDALRLVAKAIESLRGKDRAFLIITHYSRILHHVRPTHVHVMVDGRIVESGGWELAERVEREGYREWVA